MSYLTIAILAIVQGLAELLPVSSSAHVIFAQKLLGLDPSAPEMTFLIVMLHTGTMFAVLLYFGSRWKKLWDSSGRSLVRSLVIATAVTGVLGLGFKIGIEKVILEKMLHHSKGEVESLFSVLPLIGGALAAAGVLILIASRRDPAIPHGAPAPGTTAIDDRQSIIIGAVQGLCLPFRGFSRSGATISSGLLLGINRVLSEEFSFALAVLLTPPVILLELRRLMKANAAAATPMHLSALLGPGLVGMVFSFGAGLVALKWLSSWLEKGRWKYFGVYCLIFSVVIFAAWAQGF